MTYPLVIGLTGPIGSGKDTLASGVMGKLPNVVRMKFAQPLYSMAAALDPAFSPSMPHADKDAPLLDIEGFPTRRKVLETLGTEWGRALRPTLWLDILEAQIEAAVADIVIITDVRFPNEAEFIRDCGTLVHLYPNWDCSGTGHQSDRRLLRHADDHVISLSHGAVSAGVDELLKVISKARQSL